MTYAANLGAGFSGLLAGFFVVLQRPSDPNFSAFWYFFMIGEIVTVGLIALLYGNCFFFFIYSFIYLFFIIYLFIYLFIYFFFFFCSYSYS